MKHAHAPVAPVWTPILGIELWAAEHAHDCRPAEADIVHEPKLTTLIRNIEEARSLHRPCPYENRR